jgi:hypothetical protein
MVRALPKLKILGPDSRFFRALDRDLDLPPCKGTITSPDPDLVAKKSSTTSDENANEEIHKND